MRRGVACDGSEGWSTYDPSTPATYTVLHVDGCDGGWPVMDVKDGVLTIPQPPATYIGLHVDG